MEPSVGADSEDSVLDARLLEFLPEAVSAPLLPRDHCLDTVCASTLGLRSDDPDVQRRQAPRRIGDASEYVRRAERWTRIHQTEWLEFAGCVYG